MPAGLLLAAVCALPQGANAPRDDLPGAGLPHPHLLGVRGRGPHRLRQERVRAPVIPSPLPAATPNGTRIGYGSCPPPSQVSPPRGYP